MATGLTFVSYSRTDSDFAVKLASDLRERGADVWLDQLDIEAGSRWDTAVEAALGRSARLLVLLTPKSVASQNVLDEVSYALDEGKTVLPVLVEACAIPMRMRRLQHVDFTRGYEPGLARLLTTLGVAQPQPATVPPQPAAPAPRPTVQEPAPRQPRKRNPPPPRLEPTPPVPPAVDVHTDVVRSPAPTRSGGPSLAASVAGLVIGMLAVFWFWSNGSSTPEPAAEPPAAATDVPTAPPADPAAAATDPRTSAAAPSTTAGGTTPQSPRTAPAGTSVSALLQELDSVASTRSTGPQDDAGLQALRTLTRQFGTRASLGTLELEQVADAQLDACPNQPPSSPCNTTASNLVESLLVTVCNRQTGPAPPPASDERTLLMWETKALQCKQAYLGSILTQMDVRARDAIKKIKAG